MMRSLYAGISGLRAHQTRMDVIGNNISNVNTAGYKKSRVTFSEMLNQTMRGASSPQGNKGGTNPLQIGLGVKLGSIDVIHTAGTPQSTGKTLDMAIEGEGYFIVGDSMNSYFTRAGNFDFDTENNLHLNGYLVKGWVASQDPGTNEITLDNSGAIEPINLSSLAGVQIMQSTTNMTIGKNLDKRVDSRELPSVEAYTDTIDLADPANYPVDIVLGPGTVIDSNFEITDGTTTVDYTTLIGNSDWSFDTTTGTLTFDPAAATSLFSTFNPGITVNYTNQNDVSTYVDNAVTGSDITGANPSDENTWATIELGSGVVFDNNFTIRDESGHSVSYTDLVNNMGDWDLDTSTGKLVIKNGSSPIFSALSGTDNVVVNYQKSEHPTPRTVYDSQGGAHEVTVTYYKSGDNEWKASIAMDGDLVDNGYEHTLRFTNNGQIDPTTSTLDIRKSLGGGVDDLEISIDFSNLTQVASDTSALALSQNGYEAGSLDYISVDTNGTLVGTFTNGQNIDLAQVALATFNNPGGLEKTGNTLFKETKNSGLAQVGAPGQDGKGVISPESLEMSNVDLSQEFVDMIVTQRGFQANSRIITTSDQILEELVNLRR